MFGDSPTAEFKVVFTDTNGDSRNFRKGQSNLYDLDPDDQTDTTTLKAKKKKAKLKVKLQGEKIEVVEPPIEPPVIDPPVEIEEGTTITLTAQQDVYSEAFGGSVIGADFVQNELRFTVVRTPSSLRAPQGATDDLSDATTGDGMTQSRHQCPEQPQNTVANVVQVAGRSFTVTSTNDN